MNTILFTPLEIGTLKLRNRLNIPPMCMWRAENGMAKDFTLHHYSALADSGVGAVTIEATAVTPDGRISPWCLGLWSDEHTKSIASIVKAIKETDPEVKVIIQLAHAGRKAGCSPMTDQSIPLSEGGWQTVAPSALSASSTLSVPKELTVLEIRKYVKAFSDAAARAVAAGVDAIMIHAAHGYLIHEFLSPISNVRTDAYGGSYENRTRFAKEVIQAIKENVPASYPVGIRISATDWRDDGWNLDESVKFAQEIQDQGISFIDVSTGGLINVPIPVAPGYQLPFAARIRKETGLKVFGVGLITEAFQAETALQLGACDVIDVGRAILNDLNFGWHAAAKLGAHNVKASFERTFALQH